MQYPRSQSGLPAASTTAFSYSETYDTLDDSSIDVETDRKYIAQRAAAVQDIYNQLFEPGTNAIVLTGIAGVGKSTLAGLLYNHTNDQDNRPLPGPSFWYTVQPSDTFVNVATRLYEAFQVPPPRFAEGSWKAHAQELFGLLRKHNQPRLIVLNQFELLLDEKTLQAKDTALSEFLQLLNKVPIGCRLALTSHIFPSIQQRPIRLQNYSVGGLETKEGVQWLRDQGMEGRIVDLERAVERCGGHGQALDFLMQIAKDNKNNLTALFKDTGNVQSWDGLATKFLDDIYKKLLEDQERALLRVFSAYREPVPLDAAQLLLEPGDAAQNLNATLHKLEERHLLMKDPRQKAGKTRYILHPLVASYALRQFNRSSGQQNPKALSLSQAHKKIAEEYYVAQKRPAPGYRNIDDMISLEEAVWHLGEAGERAEALDLMQKEKIITDLKRLGQYTVLLEEGTMLQSAGGWQKQPWHEAYICMLLGEVNKELGRLLEARRQYERSLPVYGKGGEEAGIVLSQLGEICDDLGQLEDATKYLKQAVAVLNTADKKRLSAKALRKLGDIYDKSKDSKDREQARQYYEDALRISNEGSDPDGEAEALIKLGDSQYDQGNIELGRQYYLQALKILSQQVPENQLLQALVYNKLGDTYIQQGELVDALKSYDEAYRRYERGKDPRGMASSLNKRGDILNRQDKKDDALKCFQDSLYYYQRTGDRGGEAESLNNLGRVYHDISKRLEAINSYKEALGVFVEVEYVRRQGWTLSNIGLVYATLHDAPDKKAEDFAEALEYYNQALILLSKVVDRAMEGVTFTCRGQMYYELAKIRNLSDYYLRALNDFIQAYQRHREANNQVMGGTTLQEAGCLIMEPALTRALLEPAFTREEVGFACLLCAKQLFDTVGTSFHKDKVNQSLELINKDKGNALFMQLWRKVGPNRWNIAEEALR